MGLKSKLSKMKSFLFDEEDDDKEVRKVKKNSFKIDKKISNNIEEDFSKTTEIEELSFDDVDTSSFDDGADIKSRVEKVETEFKFPEFDDDDFMVERPRKEEIKPIIKEEPKILLYQGSKRKEELKKFKPTPMISPVFGLLDKDGNTVPKEAKKSEYKSIKDEVSFDDVRKKAYGSFDEELENTMKRLSKKTIEEAEKDMEEEEKFEREIKKEVLVHEIEEKTTLDEDDDDMILPNINFKEIDVDKERKKNELKNEEKEISRAETHNKEDDDEDTKEQDLFNLLDSIYQKGDE